MELFHSVHHLHNPHLGLKSFFVLVAALVVILMSQAVVATDSTVDAPEDLTHIWVLQIEAALRAYRGPRGGPTWGSRNAAIALLALHDGYQLFVREYDSYLVYSPALIAQADQILQSFPDQSEALGEIAATGAIAEALGSLYPPGSQYDSALAQSIEVADPSHSLDAATIDATVSLGRQVGAQLVLARSNDGSDEAAQADLDYVLPPANGQAGLWSPDPTVSPSQRALGVAWGSVRPFAMRNVHEYVIPPPPAFPTEPWANTYNQAKLWGVWNSTVRTEEELETAYFWAYDRSGMGPPINIFLHWAENVANVKGLVMSDKVRLLALTSMAMADAGIAAWEWKYVYNFWRPVTAIRAGGTDNNPRTVAQPDWRPLGAPAVPVFEGDEMIPVVNMTVDSFTPPFPAYPSGHATFGEAVAEVLRNVVGTGKFEYSIQSDEMPSELKTRNYTSLDQPSYENCISRIYLGVHWIVDCNSGYVLGRDVAMNVAFNWLKPIGTGGFQVSDSDTPPDGECNCTRTTRKRSRRNVRRTRVAAMKK